MICNIQSNAMCVHPELFPTQWEQKKPEPCHFMQCKCGKNMTCPVCGWGMGCYPCDCDKVEERKEIWSNA